MTATIIALTHNPNQMKNMIKQETQENLSLVNLPYKKRTPNTNKGRNKLPQAGASYICFFEPNEPQNNTDDFRILLKQIPNNFPKIKISENLRSYEVIDPMTKCVEEESCNPLFNPIPYGAGQYPDLCFNLVLHVS